MHARETTNGRKQGARAETGEGSSRRKQQDVPQEDWTRNRGREQQDARQERQAGHRQWKVEDHAERIQHIEVLAKARHKT